MRYLTLAEVLHIHEGVLAQSGGLSGVRDLAALESAMSQPKASAGGADAYPSLVEKAAALCYSLCSKHPFVDGNKRVAHAAMEVFLILNGSEIAPPSTSKNGSCWGLHLEASVGSNSPHGLRSTHTGSVVVPYNNRLRRTVIRRRGRAARAARWTCGHAAAEPER
jgi:death-on-curing protein